uniref:Ig-like domain-containing protein n=1 Tax=Chelonoidis abingdonii TaxID=106734 RepID=A0A8C0IXE1_CHEAB
GCCLFGPINPQNAGLPPGISHLGDQPVPEGSVVFPFKVPPWVPVETIVWNSVTTLATFTPRKGKPAAVKVLDKRYIGRLRVLDHTYSLVISNLSILDRGIYRAQINTEFTTTVTEYLLRVYSEFPDVAVAILNGTCNLLLNCSVTEGLESATFIWTYTRRRIIQIKEGPTLRILSRPRAKDMVHTCLAKNPVSQGSKTISIEDYCGNFLSNRLEKPEKTYLFKKCLLEQYKHSSIILGLLIFLITRQFAATKL